MFLIFSNNNGRGWWHNTFVNRKTSFVINRKNRYQFEGYHTIDFKSSRSPRVKVYSSFKIVDTNTNPIVLYIFILYAEFFSNTFSNLLTITFSIFLRAYWNSVSTYCKNYVNWFNQWHTRFLYENYFCIMSRSREE